MEKAADLLESCPHLVTFNGIGFDIPVIEGILDRKIPLSYHFDLLSLIWEALNDKRASKRGYTLNDVAHRTLGRGKRGSGTHAPALAEDGHFGELFEYCLQDVLLTRELAQFVQQHGGIIDVNGEVLPLPVPEWFSDLRI